MTKIEWYLEELMNRVCTDLGGMYPSDRQSSEYGLIFPTKRDGTIRISEQEAKLLFVQHLTIDQKYFFSVETPTAQTYQQKGKTPMSARVDLTLFGGDRKPAAHIELKAHNCVVENIRKDLEKLLRERTAGMWFHTLYRANSGTMATLIRKFKAAFSVLPECLRINDRSYLIAFFVLEDARLHWQWLHLSGEEARNREAIAAAFKEDIHCPPWSTATFRDSSADESPRSESGTQQKMAKGKGARQGFLVFIPTLASDTFLHLSVRGGSYRLRQYDLKQPSKRPRVFTAPSCSTVENLLAGNIIEERIPVTVEDLAHSIDDEPQYWCGRIRAVNLAHLAAKSTR
jgi:hypothetical protein